MKPETKAYLIKNATLYLLRNPGEYTNPSTDLSHIFKDIWDTLKSDYSPAQLQEMKSELKELSATDERLW